ncbi:MAG: metallophosphoesterase [Lachnospiraceae bacterium]|nr:metallophosphoesterase [Lachnospiraceae bacterium]
MGNWLHVTIFFGGMLIFLGLLGIWLMTMVKNIMEQLFEEKLPKKTRTLISFLGVILLVCCAIKWSMGIVALLYFIGFGFVFFAINFLVKLMAKDSYEKLTWWKVLNRLSILPMIATLGMLIFGYWNMHHVVETTYVVETKKEIAEEGYRVALLSDIHYGISIDKRELQRMVEKVNGSLVDVVVLCGDMVDEDTTKAQMQELFSVLGTLDSKYGVFFVYGNHDLQNYTSSSSFTQQELCKAMEENNIIILQDSAYELTNDFVLVGRQDVSMGSRKGLDTLYENMDKRDFILTLDHQPLDYKENKEQGTDLLLSGHTHGGQLFPINLLLKVIPFGEGVYGQKKMEDFTAIVSSGVAGWRFPVKTSAPAEYVIVHIK